MLWIELIGYVGSILIAVSLMMRNILKLRIINMVGAMLFMVYGLIIISYPVFAVNLFIMFVNIYFLAEIKTKKDYFTVLPAESHESPFLQKFVDFYYEDIHKVFPDFKLKDMENTDILIILRNMIPVGFFISKPLDNNQISILIDYIIPAYRDFKNSIFLHSEEIIKYREEGYKTLITSTTIGIHRKYLLKMGYIQDTEEKSLFRRGI